MTNSSAKRSARPAPTRARTQNPAEPRTPTSLAPEHPPPPSLLRALLRAWGLQPDLFPLVPLNRCIGRLSRLLHDALRGLCGRFWGLRGSFLKPPQPCWRNGVGAPREADVRGLDVAALLQVLLHRYDPGLSKFHAQLLGHLRGARHDEPDGGAPSLRPVRRAQDNPRQLFGLTCHSHPPNTLLHQGFSEPSCASSLPGREPGAAVLL